MSGTVERECLYLIRPIAYYPSGVPDPKLSRDCPTPGTPLCSSLFAAKHTLIGSVLRSSVQGAFAKDQVAMLYLVLARPSSVILSFVAQRS